VRVGGGRSPIGRGKQSRCNGKQNSRGDNQAAETWVGRCATISERGYKVIGAYQKKGRESGDMQSKNAGIDLPFANGGYHKGRARGGRIETQARKGAEDASEGVVPSLRGPPMGRGKMGPGSPLK